jgi:hypothetical protein
MPIFCGCGAGSVQQRIAVKEARDALTDELDQAEWHDIALHTTIGQGLILDLLRQRPPVEQITLALPTSHLERGATSVASSQPLDEALTFARSVVEILLVVNRGALAVLDPQLGGRMTIMRAYDRQLSDPAELALDAFVTQFVGAESERWASRGLHLSLRR